MARVGSIVFQINTILKEHNGIGISKLESRNNSGLSAENGHKVSNYFHSHKSMTNARRDLMNLGKYAKENYNIKNIKNITKDVINNWIKSKEISYHTASNYLSEINKVKTHLGITQEEIKALRATYKSSLSKGELSQQTRAYKKLDIITLGYKSQIAFELQRDYGLRLKEATHINLERQHIQGTTLSIQSKGGKQITIEISKTLLKKIETQANDKKIFSVHQKTYQEALKIAILKTGQKFNGTHGIRHSFAQKKLEEGYTKQQVSEMMGHTRQEITNTYLR